MKNKCLIRHVLLVSLTALVCSRAFAFQIADGTPPSIAPAARYIFYWGTYQCELSAANGYRDSLTFTPTGFRQLLLSPPKIWNGKNLVEHLTFKIENIPVSTIDYLGQLAQLDVLLGSKAQPGKVLHLTDLKLEEGVWGRIGFTIEADESEHNKLPVGNNAIQGSTYLNDQFLDGAVWGREDIYEVSDRDYFTVNEFWQNIRQEPTVEWKSYLQPQVLRSEINFTSKEKTTIGIVVRLEDNAYSGMLGSLENYRHMVHPGAIVVLQLKRADQYDLLYKKTMNIVANDDPRLRLRRKRDQHTLTIRWGDWYEKVKDLYLTRYTNPQGENILVDAPVTRNAGISFSDVSRANWGKQKPVCLIDDEPVSSDISFRVTVSDSLILQVHSDQYDADSVVHFFAQNGLNIRDLMIDSIQIEGYDLPPMAFSIFMVKLRDGKLVRNEFSILRMFADNPSSVKMSAPVLGKTDVEFTFDLPEKSPIVLSIFEAGGWNTYFQDGTFGPGQSVIRVPRTVFRDKGKHFAFVNSTFGVAKVAFEVD